MTHPEVADLTTKRHEVLAVAPALWHVEFEQVLLLHSERPPPHGAPLALFQESRQLLKKRGRRLVWQFWPGSLAPIDFS